MKKVNFKTTAMIAMILCLVLAVSLLSGCAKTAGIAPHIGENGNWWIGEEDTGVKATGEKGADGTPGAVGLAPHVGENGNWWVGDVDTGVAVKAQDGVITEYVTPEQFGAKGDGKADDTAAMLKALQAGKPVFLAKTYKVKDLDCTGIDKIVMYGNEDVSSRLSSFTNGLAADEYNIRFEGKELFKNAPEKISIQQLRFYATNKTAVLTKSKVSGAWVHKCNFTYFGGLFMGGMDGFSNISENVFFQMRGPVGTDCADSIISSNYINSQLSSRVTLFSGTSFTGMHFSNNFVDYCKIAFGKYDLWEHNLIENNVFDSAFRVFDTGAMLNHTTITGNNFARINREAPAGQATGLSEFGTLADTEMKTQDWRVFNITGECNKTNISANAGEAETALVMTNVNNPCDTVIDVSGITGGREFSYNNTTNAAGSSIVVRDMDYITVDSLPSAALYDAGGAALTSFNNQHVFYAGNLYINNNGNWLQLTNNAQQ